MEDLLIQNVDLEKSENLEIHKTEDFSDSKVLVLRRGAPFKVTLQLGGRAFNPHTDSLRIKILLGRLYSIMPVTFSKTVSSSSSSWKACFDPKDLNLQNPSIFLSSPASAPVGIYRFAMYVSSKNGWHRSRFSTFVLVCNPWCREDAVYIPFEDEREEYVLNTSGLLFMGTAVNNVSRPWSFDQYEPGVLEACLNLLQISPQHLKNRRVDYLNRNNPVYISRVVSAMINCEDDHGILKGNWSGDFKQGVNPTMWTGSGDILLQWARSGFSPVKYGQCWVYAAVMCTVMRVLGIPCRVVTNFNSAHDTNANLVIEEYYSETGQKLKLSKDSIWNFHVWVECWMNRRDLGSGMDGWQVLDPTPQERSGGVYCCGPAPVKAIKDRHINLPYDIPFVYAEVNADVHTVIISQGRAISYHKDKDRVGSLICTKAVGFPRLQNITENYKYTKSPTSTLRSHSSTMSGDSALSAGASPKEVSVSLILDKAPLAGQPISFTMKITNKQSVPKRMNVHINAQVKEYNNSPSDTFWEKQGIIHLAPREVTLLQQQIHPDEYESVVGDNLINLAVVLEDMATHERYLASDEFNITSPKLHIQVERETSIVLHKEQAAVVAFTNPFTHNISGEVIVSGSGLIQGKLHCRISALPPGGTVIKRFTFTPRMAGAKMLQATLFLSDISTVITGFEMVVVRKASTTYY
ncbi:transglutaminase 5, like [Echeneis naucrates]|uniref:transglutaminase 5, like n=1 Tax=Echeneis naucrates TaxID=173247 RepID=UPI001113AA8D|nr:protein-glutamine gamma-glutamyltransferase 2-like [Echeneis naucrates]